MKKIMFNFIKKYWKEVILIISILFIGIIIYNNTHLRQELKYKEHNITVLNDSLHKWQLKEGDWIFERGLLIINSKKELEKLTNFKNSEIKSLEKELNKKIISIVDLNATIDMLNGTIKELESNIVKTDSNTYRLNFKQSDKWRNLEGYTEVISSIEPTSYKTLLTKDIITINLQTGLTKDNTIFIKTDCPYINFNRIDGAIIDPDAFAKAEKIKRWYFGPMVGYGYYMNNNKFGVFIGLGVGYKIFSW